jgi:2-polyprenyl-3-methyl-5-hydroxy-6-metoxy-1,4-benzoquinol methylase
MLESKFHTTCLICKSSDLLELKKYESSYLNKCKSCGFVFSKKNPSEEELVSHYEQYSRNDYLPPLTIKRYNELLDEMEKYRRTNNLLDVGTGMGYFLEQAMLRGWNVYGTEFTDEAIEICKSKGIKMNQGALDSDWFEEYFFDVVTSLEVIEHINNPQIDLKNINKVLRVGGLFYCTTPNFNSISRFYLKNKWNIITYPEHLSYYTSSTLSDLLNENRLAVEILLTTGISLSRIQSSKHDQKNFVPIATDSSDEIIRNQLENNVLYRGLKIVINSFLTSFKIGDTIKIYATKE